MVDFRCTRQESAIIRQLVERAVTAFPQLNRVDVAMDLAMVHCNGCPLDLEAMLVAEPVTFGADIVGIRQHLDRSTGKLPGWYRPRYTMVTDIDQDEQGNLRLIARKRPPVRTRLS